jgi:hypothetical protein
VILSTIKRLAERRPLCGLGPMSNRMSGASVSSVVKAQTVIEAVGVEAIVLHDNYWPWLSCVVVAASRYHFASFKALAQANVRHCIDEGG